MHGLESFVTHIVQHYGYVGLFGLLSLGMIGVPVPDELLMTFSGFQVSLGHMAFVKTILVAAAGSFLGMNLSYWIGRKLGIPFLHKIAPYVHLNENKIARAEHWFQRFGDKLIVIGYFFPGFRHLTAYFSGMSKLHYARFGSLAGLGALLWAASFVLLGRSLGVHWKRITLSLHYWLRWGGLLLLLVIIGIYLYNVKRGRVEPEE